MNEQTDAQSDHRPPRSPLAAWIGPLLILAAGAAMLVWTWGRWADVFIDFGRELYVPWRIAAGEVLYRDLAYLNGPLSPTFNAALFALFGTGIRTLAIANIVLIGVQIVVLYRLLAFVGSRFSATIASLVFVLLFAFGTQRITGNYNNVMPYSHELTHGIL
ncbi:MAG: hypothetical protein GF328_09440, partial [Candidatus Latescibacteria bacterium]|nr:hypothetical protein [Candidatus Latescibacterota bacterium]